MRPSSEPTTTLGRRPFSTSATFLLRQALRFLTGVYKIKTFELLIGSPPALLVKAPHGAKHGNIVTTVYSAILREIQTKGKDARFKKVERGHFELA